MDLITPLVLKISVGRALINDSIIRGEHVDVIFVRKGSRND